MVGTLEVLANQRGATPKPLTVSGVADRWGCSTTFVYAQIASGALVSWKLGRHYRVTQAALEAFECRGLAAIEDVPAVDLSAPPIETASAYHSARLIRRRHQP